MNHNPVGNLGWLNLSACQCRVVCRQTDGVLAPPCINHQPISCGLFDVLTKVLAPLRSGCATCMAGHPALCSIATQQGLHATRQCILGTRTACACATRALLLLQALRTCPVCRTPTYFITPSTKWPDTPDDKHAIVDAYKAAMAQKDCVHFAFGEGSCPFGTSCFYRHAYRDGRLEVSSAPVSWR